MLKAVDPEMENIIKKELGRIRNGLELIPAENFTSRAVLQALGSVLTNKYSEGYPGKRYYGGNEFVDEAESLAIERAKKLFGAEHVNVQPLSGSPANMAVYYAVMEIGDTFMGLKLTEGGHLTHGHPVNFSGRHYKCVQYGLNRETELLDYDAIERQARKVKPKLILSGYTAYPRKIDFRRFREICNNIGAFCMGDIAHIAGLCAAGVHENPVPYFDAVTTTTHKTLRGPRGAIIMCKHEFAEKIDRAVFPGLQGGPHDNTNAAKAVAFKEALQPEFKDYSKRIIDNARALADELMAQGFRLVTGGTDNHLMLVDVWKKSITGKQAENLLESVGIYVNKNTIPYDSRSPFDPSGIRLGTPALTTRGMGRNEMKEIGRLIAKVLMNRGKAKAKMVREEVLSLCSQFPLYPDLPDGHVH